MAGIGSRRRAGGRQRGGRGVTPELELELYRRAYNMAKLALMAIAVYGDINHEQWLLDHGYTPEMIQGWNSTSNHYEYIRKMDYEIAEQALDEIARMLRLGRDAANRNP